MSEVQSRFIIVFGPENYNLDVLSSALRAADIQFEITFVHDAVEVNRLLRIHKDAVLVAIVQDADDVADIEPLLDQIALYPLIVLLPDYNAAIIDQLTKQGVADYLVETQLDSLMLHRVFNAQAFNVPVHIPIDVKAPVSKYSDILQRSTDGIVVTDPDGIVVFTNPSAESLFRRTPKLLLGQTFGFPVVAGESIEIEIMRPQGEMITVEMRVSNVQWANKNARLIALRDVSDRKAMEVALRKSHTLNKAIIDTLSTSIAVVNIDGEIISVNDKWYINAPMSCNTILQPFNPGVNYFDVCRNSNSDTAYKALEGMLAVLTGEESAFQLEFRCDEDHPERWFLMNVKPLYVSGMEGLLVSHTEITRQRASAFAEADRRAAVARRIEQDHEMHSIELLSQSQQAERSRRSVPEVQRLTPEAIETFSDEYSRLLSLAVEQRAYKVEHNVAEQGRDFARKLGLAGAHPRDVIKIHLDVLQAKRRQIDKAVKTQVYLEEGRILLLEIMGYLASFYRDQLDWKENIRY